MINNWDNMFESKANSMFNPQNMNQAFYNGACMNINANNNIVNNMNKDIGWGQGYMIQDPNKEDLSSYAQNYYHQTFGS